MPHVIEAMAANGGFARADDPDLVNMNCRIASELGADIVKTDWCGPEGMARVARDCIAPVCVAGGAKEGDEAGLVDIASAAVQNGARGLFFGRNVFQRPDVEGLVRKLATALA